MALRVMCKYYTLLTPSLSREGPTHPANSFPIEFSGGCIINWYASHTHHMIACMSHHVGVISFMTSTVSLKNESIVRHISNHCAFLRLVWPRGWGNCPVCDSSGSPIINGSPSPRRLTKCSSTGLHGNLTDGSPGGGRSMLGDGPKTLFFIAMQPIMILFITPSFSRQKVGSVSELLGDHAK